MRRCGRNVVGIAVGACLAIGASATPPPKPTAPARAVVGRGLLKSLAVAPSRIMLAGPLAQQHLLVTGRYSDGAEVDLTSTAAFTLGKSGVARLDKLGAFVPVGSMLASVVC